MKREVKRVSDTVADLEEVRPGGGSIGQNEDMAETATEIITIDAPPEKVWDIAVDLPRYPEWARDIKSVTIHRTDA